MTSIERMAYPRLKRRPSAQELADVYTPTVEDLTFIRATARGPSDYSAALVGELVGPDGIVASVDVDPPGTARARSLLSNNG